VLRGLLACEHTVAAAQQAHAALPQLGWVLPEFAPASASGAAEHPDLDRAEVRFRFFDAVGIFLQRVSAAQPLLIFLDDLHWADEASLLLLDFVIGALANARVHLIGAFRDPPRPTQTLARLLAAASSLRSTERYELRGLCREAVSLLLTTATVQAPAPAVVDAVLASTSGNPLFVTELAKLAARGEFDLAQAKERLPVPTRVRDVLRWQFERLSSDCQRVLQLLSTAASGLELAVLARAAGMDTAVLLVRLGEAEAIGLAVGRQERTRRVGFVHDLVRESIYRDIPTPTRMGLHRAAAEALEALAAESPAADVGQIAYHYALAAADRAVHFSRAAGRQANTRMAYEDAVDHYERALQALPLLAAPDPTLACELLFEQAEAAWGTHEEAAFVQKRFEAAAAAARAAGQPELLARAALGRSGHRAGPGDYRDISIVDEQDIALLSEAAAALGGTDSELHALVLARLALAVRYGREFHVAERLARQACRMAEACGDSGTLAEALRYCHEVLSGPQFVRERLEIAQRMLPLARTVRSRPLELDALIFTGRDCFKQLDYAGAKAAGDAADALAATMRHPAALFRSGMRTVFVESLRGRLDQAERCAREFYVRDAARNLGADGTLDIQLIMIALLRDDHASALAALARMAARYPDLAWVDCALARQHAALGDRAEAERWLARASADGYVRIENHHTTLGAYLHLTEACVELGDTRRAAQLYRRMTPYERLMASSFLGIIWQGPVAYGLGRLAGLLQDRERAKRHFEYALEIVQPLRSAPLTAMVNERLGKLLLECGRKGDHERAVMLLRSTVELAERAGMRGVARRCRVAIAK
jgi:tetratricopeptide (TPR) repeat protein